MKLINNIYETFISKTNNETKNTHHKFETYNILMKQTVSQNTNNLKQITNKLTLEIKKDN